MYPAKRCLTNCFRNLLEFLVCMQALTVVAQYAPRYNRFQYHKYHWKVYHGSKFHIYFPADAADSLYRFILKETPDAIEHIKKVTIKDVPKNLNIILYPSVDQLYETNIGGYEPANYTLPTFAYKGTRVVLAYNGSYADLKAQLYEGIVRALWESQFRDEGGGDEKGSADKKRPKSGVTSKNDGIPFWYKEGAIRYFAHGWTIHAEDNLRNSFQDRKFATWQQVINYEPRLAGHAFCYFLSRNYYPTAVTQLTFQLKKKKSLARAIRLITKQSLDTLYTQCYEFYSKRFENSKGTLPLKTNITIPHKKGIITNVLRSPDRALIAYTLLSKNKRTVYVYNIAENTTTKIASYRLPPWIDDHSSDQYPLISWHKDGRQLYVAKPKRGRIEIYRYTMSGIYVENTTLYGVDGITSFQPLSDREFLLSAFRKGQGDIVSYDDNKDRYLPYTDDEYDDASPVGSKDQLFFVSNRPKKFQWQKTFLIGVGFKKDTLWQGIFSVQDSDIVPVIIDSNWYIKWDKPVVLKDNRLLLTSTQYGTERYTLLDYPGGNITTLNTYQTSQYFPDSDRISFFRSGKDSVYISIEPMEDWIKENKAAPSDTVSPWLQDYREMLAKQAREDSLLRKGKDTTHYFMEDVFAPKGDKKKAKEKKSRKKEPATNSDGVTPYVLQLHSAYFTAQVNNDYFINRYQPYRNYLGQFKFPEISGMTKGGFTDLFENHHFTIAYALPAATDGSTFFVRYENTARMIDWGLSYFRKVETLKPDPSRNWVDENGNKYPQSAKDKTHYYEFFAKKPLTYDCSLGLQIAVRQDRTVFLATDKYSLDFAPIEAAWSINTLSFHLNKEHPTIPYLSSGYKVDAHMDVCRGFDKDEAFLFASAVDVKYSLPVYKYITLVVQAHTGHSGGDANILYNLGGVDNNVTPRVDTSVHFSQNAPYAFQTLVTPFRGWYQNTLYGNQYLLANADLYFPIFQTLIPIHTPLSFINNLQLGLLSDVGSTQETWNDNNPNNKKWLWSYGLSARSTLAGYPLRLEVAWPGTFNKQPVWYFSLNLQ